MPGMWGNVFLSMMIFLFVVGDNSTELIDIFQAFPYGADSINISGGVMTKSDIIKRLHNENDLTKNEAATVLDTFFNEMAGALAKGDRVEIRGLGAFHVRKYKAYTGRNPKTGEKVKIKPKKLPFFKCGKDLKDRVDHK